MVVLFYFESGFVDVEKRFGERRYIYLFAAVTSVILKAPDLDKETGDFFDVDSE